MALSSTWEADDGFNARDCEQIAAGFRNNGFLDITADHIANWYDGTGRGGFRKVESAGKKLLGKVTYEYYDSMARLVPALQYKLQIIKERTCGGIKLNLTDADFTLRIDQ